MKQLIVTEFYFFTKLLNEKRPFLLQEMVFLISVRWHLPTLPPVTAVPSAVRGLTALFDKVEVFTRLKSTSLIDSFDRFTGQYFYSFSLQRETLIIFIIYLLTGTYQLVVRHTLNASGVISTARLNASLRFHLPPINVVVYNTPLYRNTHLQASFALRCFQRLSDPHVATRPCLRPNNRCASGESIPVLSY